MAGNTRECQNQDQRGGMDGVGVRPRIGVAPKAEGAGNDASSSRLSREFTRATPSRFGRRALGTGLPWKQRST